MLLVIVTGFLLDLQPVDNPCTLLVFLFILASGGPKRAFRKKKKH